jgi:hypothetical protein
MRVAIIGAGIAGLSAARVLQAAGVEVTVLDKGRGPGGRLASRRATTPLGEVSFDHGAQYFTVRSPEFREAIAALRQAGAVARWTGRFARMDAATGDIEPVPSEDRWVGTPTMSALIRALCEGLDVHVSRAVARLSQSPEGWTLLDADGATLAQADAVLLTIPPVQARVLLDPVAPELSDALRVAELAPCWTVMLAFAEPLSWPYDAVALTNSPLAWAARNASKPGRAPIDTWVLQASPETTREDLSKPPEAVINRLLPVLNLGANRVLNPIYAEAHRWLYARVEAEMPVPSLWNPLTRLGTAGDWHIGPRIEAAWLSGQALARQVLEG